MSIHCKKIAPGSQVAFKAAAASPRTKIPQHAELVPFS
jgi:hypothetical protein